jgi:hypothetical protein
MGNDGGLTDREAVIDAVVRFVCSLDEADPDMLASSITEDMVMDLTPFSQIGRKYEPLKGKETVVSTLMKNVGTNLDSTHHVSNFRIELNGDEANLRCYALAQHYRKGHGPGDKYTDYYLMGNKYDCTIVRDGGVWKIKTFVLIPAWTQGNPSVMNVE